MSQSICPHVTFAYTPPKEKKGHGLSLCVYPDAVDKERDEYEEDGVAKNEEGELLCASGTDCGGETEWSLSR